MPESCPQEPQSGMELLRWARQITRYLRSITPRSESGLNFSRTSAGTTFKPGVVRRVPQGKRHPFEVYAVGNDKVRVVPGTVNNIIPDTIGEDPGEGEEAPEVVAWEFAAGAGEQYVCLRAEIDGDGVITGAEIAVHDEIPEQPEGDTETGSAPPHSYRVIARLYRHEEKLRVENYASGSQWVQTVVSGWNCDEQRVRVLWVEQILLPF